MRRILINATQPEEIRVAIVNGQKLENLDIEHAAFQQKKSNIYKGIITRVEPSLEAAFVNYGADRHGFLPFKEIARSYIDTKEKNNRGHLDVKKGISEGLEIIVQVEKEERGNKGAALTTHISLAGRYLVLMPNNPRAGGVSRRIEGEERSAIRKEIADMTVPKGMGTIVRTAGVGRNSEELQWDLDYQVNIWNAVQSASDEKPAPFLIYQESSLIVRALRDNYNSEIGEILIDNDDVYDEAATFIDQYMPQNRRKLKHYTESTPLFNRFQIEQQIESAFNREVTLPSGGAIVIDPTEALISIDVNSARATKGSDIEETATNTNLEAAEEVARQLRLRDIGGLVVIDFIDMLASKNQRKVENKLRDSLSMDRARVQTGKISRFGLMEMSRQRIKSALGESSQLICPRCSGAGNIRGIDSLSLSILRIMEDEAMKDNTKSVIAKVPVNVATFLLNEKRDIISESEKRNDVRFLIIPNEALDTPHFNIERVKNNEDDHESNKKNSYELTEATYKDDSDKEQAKPQTQPKAAVQSVAPSKPIPKHVEKVEKKVGLFEKLMAFLSPKKEEEKPKNRNNNGRRGRSNQYRNGRRGAKNSNSNSSNNNSRPQNKQKREREDRDEPQNRKRSRNNSSKNNQRNQKNAPGKNEQVENKSGNKPERQNNKGRNQNQGQNRKRPRNNNPADKNNENTVDEQVVDKNITNVAPAPESMEAKPEKQNNAKAKPQKNKQRKPKQEKVTENIDANETVPTSPSTNVNADTNVSKKQLSDYSSNVKSLADNKPEAAKEETTKTEKPKKAKKEAVENTETKPTVAKEEKPKAPTEKAEKPKKRTPKKKPKKEVEATTDETSEKDTKPVAKKPAKKRTRKPAAKKVEESKPVEPVVEKTKEENAE